MNPCIQSLPQPVVTLSILTLLDSSSLLAFRTSSSSCYYFVHGSRFNLSGDGEGEGGDDFSNESEDLWHHMLCSDFGFSLCGKDNKDDGGDLIYLKTFRHCDRTVSDAAESFLMTKDLVVASSSFDSWKKWRRLERKFVDDEGNAFKTRISGPLILRAARMWAKIEGWCDSSKAGSVGARIRKSFVPGNFVDTTSLFYLPIDTDISSDKLENFQALQAVWAFHGGQEPCDVSNQKAFDGLVGGYSVYGSCVCTRLVSYGEIAMKKKDAARLQQGLPTLVRIAHSPLGNADPKCFFLDRAGSLVALLGRNGMIFEVSLNLLTWLEEYASRLCKGIYEVGELMDPRVIPVWAGISDPTSILLFSTEVDRNTSVHVTRGIKIVASGVYSPETGMFIYSIQIRLLCPGENGYVPPSERGFVECQLRARHWILSYGSEVNHVRGDGVIGCYPLLKEGGYEHYEGPGATAIGAVQYGNEGCFVYQSQTRADPDGKMEGEVEFVPGNLKNPAGRAFNARVPSFSLWPDECFF